MTFHFFMQTRIVDKSGDSSPFGAHFDPAADGGLMRASAVVPIYLKALDRQRLALEFKETGVNKCRGCWVKLDHPLALWCESCEVRP